MMRNRSPSEHPGWDVRAVLSAPRLEQALQRGDIPAQGQLQMADLPRLVESGARVVESIAWEWTAALASPSLSRPRRRWWLAISGTVACRCERCLEPVNLSVRERRGFEFFDSAGEADRATEQQAHDAADSDGSGPSPEFEQLDFLSVDDGLSLRDLVEDEILLALPMAPKHANCRAPAPLGGDARLSDGSVSPGPLADEAPATTLPFAGLRDLLKKP